MKKKLFLLLMFGLCFICFSSITKAMVYDSSKSYSCNVSGYDIVYNDNKTSVYCCPSGYEAHSEGCYLPMSGAAKKVKDDCKKKGAKYILSGTQKYCKVDFKEPVATSKGGKIGNEDDSEDSSDVGVVDAGAVTYDPNKKYSCSNDKLTPMFDNSNNVVICCPPGFSVHEITSSSGYQCVNTHSLIFEDDDELKELKENCKSFQGQYGLKFEFFYVPGVESVCYSSGAKPTASSKSCGDFLDKDIVDFINEIMGWVRIAAPILLIGFGILDFVKATFSGKEEDMKKNRERFIKRIVAAILLFLVPIFVNVFLGLINQVWSWVNPDTCIK